MLDFSRGWKQPQLNMEANSNNDGDSSNNNYGAQSEVTSARLDGAPHRGRSREEKTAGPMKTQ
jgi:hypothetical protein